MLVFRNKKHCVHHHLKSPGSNHPASKPTNYPRTHLRLNSSVWSSAHQGGQLLGTPAPPGVSGPAQWHASRQRVASLGACAVRTALAQVHGSARLCWGIHTARTHGFLGSCTHLCACTCRWLRVCVHLHERVGIRMWCNLCKFMRVHAHLYACMRERMHERALKCVRAC